MDHNQWAETIRSILLSQHGMYDMDKWPKWVDGFIYSMSSFLSNDTSLKTPPSITSKPKEICVVVNRSVQVDKDKWESRATTRIFSVDRPIRDIFAWVGSLGIKNPTPNDFIIADHTGSSI